MSRRQRVILISLLALATMAGASIVAALTYPGSVRRHWKNDAIALVTQQVQDPAKVEMQRATALNQRGVNRQFWITPELLLMKNGDWIACRQVCQKQDWRIHDLFIGRGSDGKWYYSTYHFCIQFDSLMMGEQPANLDTFVSTYFLRPFDGQSDECLQNTWH